MNFLTISLLKSLRYIYTKIVPTRKWHLAPDEFSLTPQDASNHIYILLTNDNPCMIARIGSNELFCLNNYLSINSPKHSCVNYIRGIESDWWRNEEVRNQMMKCAGFFPPTNQNLDLFCTFMLNAISNVDILGSWIREENRISQLTNVLKVHLMHLEPFWCEKPWTRALAGKKVLVVHPFAQSIETQYKKRDELFENPEILPLFELYTIPAVQSIGGQCKFKDWFEALNWMKNEIDKVDYDICLIGCGAYGFLLAEYCKKRGKKAIHLGGALQLLFGIKGNRWINPNYGVNEWNLTPRTYSDLMNSSWIFPSDNEKPDGAMYVENACYWQK